MMDNGKITNKLAKENLFGILYFIITKSFFISRKNGDSY